MPALRRALQHCTATCAVGVMLQGRNRHAFDHREVHLGRMCAIDDPISMRVQCLVAGARHLLEDEFDCRRPIAIPKPLSRR